VILTELHRLSGSLHAIASNQALERFRLTRYSGALHSFAGHSLKALAARRLHCRRK
jgi:hypothetical protein